MVPHLSGFTDSPWGEKARTFVESTENISGDQWVKITLCACAFIPASELRGKGTSDLNEGNSKCVADPRACIELDWYCVFLFLVLLCTQMFF
jgi:hypothetical protein